jgi:hypothetical protein
MGKRLGVAMKAGMFYSHWYPGLLMPGGGGPAKLTPTFKPALAYVSKTSRRLARTLFHAMVKHGPKLERKQLLLGRIVDIGTELFAIVATVLYADALIRRGDRPRDELEKLAQCFVSDARHRIAGHFAALKHNNDTRNYALTQALLGGGHGYLKEGIVE